VWSADFFTHASDAGADRSRQHFESQLKGEQVSTSTFGARKSSTGLHEEAKALGLEDKMAALKWQAR